MSRLEVQQVAAPNFSASASMLEGAARSLERAGTSAQSTLARYAEGQQEKADQSVMQEIAKIGSEEELNKYLQTTDLSNRNISADMRETIFGLRDKTLGYAQNRATTEGTKANTQNTLGRLALANQQGVRAQADWVDSNKVRDESRAMAPTIIAAAIEGRTNGRGDVNQEAQLPRGEIENKVYSGLVQRGMPEHIAEGFLMNFGDESAFKVDAVEGTANVHGTYGKGLYQLTGDRRDKFEAKYGNNYSIDNQLDNMMEEIRTSESGAWEKIQQSKTAGEAAAAIVTHFLRPAEEHRVARSQKYLGAGSPPPRVTQNPYATGSRPGIEAAQNAILNSTTLSTDDAMELLNTVWGSQKSGQAEIDAANERRATDISAAAQLAAIEDPNNITKGSVVRDVIGTEGLNAQERLNAGLQAGQTADALSDVVAPATVADPLVAATAAQQEADRNRNVAADPRTVVYDEADKFQANPGGSLMEAVSNPTDNIPNEFNDRQLDMYIRQQAKENGITVGEAAAAMNAIFQELPEDGILGRAYLPDATLENRFPPNLIKEFSSSMFNEGARADYNDFRLGSQMAGIDTQTAQTQMTQLRTRAAKLPANSAERKLLEAEIETLSGQVLSNVTPRQAEQMLQQFVQRSGFSTQLRSVEPGSQEFNRIAAQIESQILNDGNLSEKEKSLLIASLRG